MIGGGASGLAAACAAARAGADVVILEQNARVGRKILTTGNGRCNLSNEDMSEDHYHGKDPGFVREALDFSGVSETLAWFGEMGLVCAAEEGRVYPFGGQASAVLDVLRLEAGRLGVRILTGQAVKRLEKAGDGFRIYPRQGETLSASRAIVAAGGLASPFSAPDGGASGLDLMKRLGHRVRGPFPALVQIRSESPYMKALKGVRADARIVLEAGGGIYERAGELQFTGNGVSGVPAMDLSGFLYDDFGCPRKDAEAYIDFVPDTEFRDLAVFLSERKARLAGAERAGSPAVDTARDNPPAADIELKNRQAAGLGRVNQPAGAERAGIQAVDAGRNNPPAAGMELKNRQAAGLGRVNQPAGAERAGIQAVDAGRNNPPAADMERYMTGFLHKALGVVLVKAAGIDLRAPAAGIGEKRILILAGTIKNFRFPVSGTNGFRDAQVMGGGLLTEEFDPATMESRLVRGLYACGEILDIYGDCGGYNLQWAWSSGRLAGARAAESLRVG
ncbi:MAG: aminoacetone oxidase family FAD-binding enzyme [Firmicutes bacterium]|nr:aminoacetone oxidase family FAD-binding enzyme [Bacillota bacterium]